MNKSELKLLCFSLCSNLARTTKVKKRIQMNLIWFSTFSIDLPFSYSSRMTEKKEEMKRGKESREKKRLEVALNCGDISGTKL